MSKQTISTNRPVYPPPFPSTYLRVSLMNDISCRLVLGGKQRVKYSTKSLSFLGGGEAGAWIDVEAGLIWDKMRDEFELVPR